MKELKITPPEGYEVDKDKSSFDCIVFKKVEKSLPKSWEELGLVSGGFVLADTTVVVTCEKVPTKEDNRNVYVSKEQAEAAIALAQLSQLREVYRDGWVPDWSDVTQIKHTVCFLPILDVYGFTSLKYFLSFQTREVASEFLNNFRDLIEKASPLLFD